VIRATEAEKKYQIAMLEQLHKTHADKTGELLEDLKHAAVKNQNLFDKLMEVTKYCSIGQVTDALYNVGGQYRRNM
jgi:methylmalonyl-CoA mutase